MEEELFIAFCKAIKAGTNSLTLPTLRDFSEGHAQMEIMLFLVTNGLLDFF
jgi:hypothetical protein